MKILKHFLITRGDSQGIDALENLSWQDYAAIRILDYLDNAGRYFDDLNLRGGKAITEPFKMLWLAYKYGLGGAQSNFFKDMIHLFRQFDGKSTRHLPSRQKVHQWMDRFPSGIDPNIIKIREKNKERIISILTRKIEKGEIKSSKYQFPGGISREEKIALVNKWWDTHVFHLKFAVRDPDFLNELLGYSLDEETMEVLHNAYKRGIPFFINPYYLSLLNVDVPDICQRCRSGYTLLYNLLETTCG
jgi:lysine 2,3-aminomutase